MESNRSLLWPAVRLRNRDGKAVPAIRKGKARHRQTLRVAGWRLHDLRRTIVSGMARLGVPPNVADKILNHQAGTISGVAAVYQRHDFLVERKEALDRWGTHVEQIVRAFKPTRTEKPLIQLEPTRILIGLEGVQ